MRQNNIRWALTAAFAAALVGVSIKAFAAPAIDFTTLGSPSAFNSAHYDSVTIDGVTIDGFVYFGDAHYRTDKGFLWMRNDDDHGLGYCSKGERCGLPNTTGDGDANELSNEVRNEVIRLTRPDGMSWSDIAVSSLDSGGTHDNETGTVYWSNIADPNLSALTSKASFSYGQISPAFEGSIFSLLPGGFDVNAKYLFFRAGPGNGTNNDYDIWGVNVTTAIPEPETYAMLLAGLGLIVLVARRRRIAVV